MDEQTVALRETLDRLLKKGAEVQGEFSRSEGADVGSTGKYGRLEVYTAHGQK